MKLILCVIVFFVGYLGLVGCELSSSVQMMENAVGAERLELEALDRYIRACDASGHKVPPHLTIFLNRTTTLNTLAAKQGFMENPLNGFHFVKRRVQAWGKVNTEIFFDYCSLEISDAYFDVVYNESLSDPITKEDLEQTGLALVRLQQTYDLDIHALFSGKILDTQTDSLSTEDIFSICGVLEINEIFYQEILWLDKFKKEISQATSKTDTTSVLLTKVTVAIAELYEIYGLPKLALKLLEEELASGDMFVDLYSKYSGTMTKMSNKLKEQERQQMPYELIYEYYDYNKLYKTKNYFDNEEKYGEFSMVDYDNDGLNYDADDESKGNAVDDYHAGDYAADDDDDNADDTTTGLDVGENGADAYGDVDDNDTAYDVYNKDKDCDDCDNNDDDDSDYDDYEDDDDEAFLLKNEIKLTDNLKQGNEGRYPKYSEHSDNMITKKYATNDAKDNVMNANTKYATHSNIDGIDVVVNDDYNSIKGAGWNQYKSSTAEAINNSRKAKKMIKEDEPNTENHEENPSQETMTMEEMKLAMFHPTSGDVDKQHYEALCRGEIKRSTQVKSTLYCKYRRTWIPLYRIKEEVLNIDPRISMFYDVITEEEMEFLKENSINHMVKSYTFGYLRNYRISQTAWMYDSDHEMVHILSKRVQLITGLSTQHFPLLSHSAAWQVVNYGFGGMYEKHHDHGNYGYTVFPEKAEHLQGAGDRLATWMFYLDDVKAGGSTVFTVLNITVPVTKGAAVFWYNIRRNGDGDPRTEHAGCPVLLGSKWIANKWILEGGQVFRRKCGHHPYDIDE